MALVCCLLPVDVNILLCCLETLLVLEKYCVGGGRRKSRSGGGVVLEKWRRGGVRLRKAWGEKVDGDVQSREQLRERDRVAIVVAGVVPLEALMFCLNNQVRNISACRRRR